MLTICFCDGISSNTESVPPCCNDISARRKRVISTEATQFNHKTPERYWPKKESIKTVKPQMSLRFVRMCTRYASSWAKSNTAPSRAEPEAVLFTNGVYLPKPKTVSITRMTILGALFVNTPKTERNSEFYNLQESLLTKTMNFRSVITQHITNIIYQVCYSWFAIGCRLI